MTKKNKTITAQEAKCFEGIKTLCKNDDPAPLVKLELGEKLWELCEDTNRPIREHYQRLALYGVPLSKHRFDLYRWMIRTREYCDAVEKYLSKSDENDFHFKDAWLHVVRKCRKERWDDAMRTIVNNRYKESSARLEQRFRALGWIPAGRGQSEAESRLNTLRDAQRYTAECLKAVQEEYASTKTETAQERKLRNEVFRECATFGVLQHRMAELGQLLNEYLHVTY